MDSNHRVIVYSDKYVEWVVGKHWLEQMSILFDVFGYTAVFLKGSLDPRESVREKENAYLDRRVLLHGKTNSYHPHVS